MKRRICTWLLVFTALLMCGGVPFSHAEGPDPGETVAEIRVEGNSRIESNTVLGAIRTKVGAAPNPAVIQEDIKRIFALGFFDDVTVASDPLPEGVLLRYQVSEVPTLVKVRFDGNKKLLEETLKDVVKLPEGGVITPAEVSKARSALLTRYRSEGYYRVRVVAVEEPVVDDKEPGKRVNVSFVIHEGERTKIRHIIFDGNRAFSDRTLRGQLKTKEWFWLTSWLTDSGIYRTDQVSEDLLRLEDYYHDRGYLDVMVSEPHTDLSTDKRWFNLSYPVQEGGKYRIGQVDYDHHEKIPPAKLEDGLSVRAGDVYNRSLIRKDVSLITDHLGEYGYAFAQVNPRLKPDPAAGTVGLAYEVDEGEQVRIRHINVSGNTKTRDRVIRRELRQQEGEIINTSLLRRSFQRINNLNYFESVNIVPVEIGKDTIDLDVQVQEKSTGQFSIGGGYSSVDGLVGMTEVSYGNFGGRGQTLSGRFERSGRRTTYNLRFLDPHMLDSDYSGEADLFNTTQNFTSYDESRVGSGLTLGKSLGEYVHASLSYTLQTLDITVKDPTAPAIIVDQAGHSTTSSVGMALSRDTLDNTFDPREGTHNVLRLEVAGVGLGGTNDFLKGTLESSIFFPMFQASAFSLRSQFGMGLGLNGKQLPPGERFFVGGIQTVRGFGYGEAGPISAYDPVGGDKEWVLSAEYTFPLVKAANLKGALFTDWGAGWDKGQSIAVSEMNLTWGYEIRWISPLGPLRFGWGWVLRDNRPPQFRKRGEQLFTIGTFF